MVLTVWRGVLLREKRKQRNIRIGKMSKAKAMIRKRELLRRVNQGSSPEPVPQDAEDGILPGWLQSQSACLRRRHTEQYTSLLRVHAIPISDASNLAESRPIASKWSTISFVPQDTRNGHTVHVHRVIRSRRLPMKLSAEKA